MSLVEISVIMPVYNEKNHLSEAIESILNQTYSNFEFIIINDGSNDSSVNIINSYKDSRIHLYHNKENSGIVQSLNRGINYSSGNFITRIDANDIAIPERFEKQIKFIKNNDVGLVGSQYYNIDENSSILNKGNNSYFEPDQTLSYLAFYNICHSTIMYKRELLERLQNPYINTPAEDFNLYLRIAEISKCYILPERLMEIRLHGHGIWSNNQLKIEKDIHRMRIEFISKLGVKPNDDEIILHSYIIAKNYKELEKISFNKIYKWMKKIISANNKIKLFPQPTFNHELYIRIGRLFLKINNNKKIINIFKLYNIMLLLGEKKNIINFIYFIRSSLKII